MASSTGIPERPPSARDDTRIDHGENEPLLGQPGDAAQVQGVSILNNLILGTGIIAELAVFLLLVLVWASVLTKPVSLFSAHPLAQSLAVFTLAQSVLALQPTHTEQQKRTGQRIHASLNFVALLLLIAGVSIIEYNKISGDAPHFHSAHGYLGVITSMVLLVQYLVGFTMWATPRLYGGVDNAKKMYKYHRYSGYFIVTLLLVTVCTATRTDYNQNVLKVKTWATALLSIFVIAGAVPRIQKQKLGFN